ncbi:hypothetical protein Tco_0704797 [Tanacetum coccineum]|uniref:Reverse transcriptase domain-containing protein n=1 Tax=Tanacetum coccineum TaxID=301880 RepID=A0ABQ4Y464_9ASTR
MADHLRPMEELLRIPIVGIKNVIVVLAVLADEFELKTELLDFVSNNPFFGFDNEDPHSHIRRFYQITRTLRLNQVPDDVVKLCQSDQDSLNTVAGGNLMTRNTQDALTIIENKAKYHFASMRETYDQNQEAAVQLMQNQMGQMADFQERPLGELPSNIRTKPLAELKEQEPKTTTEVAEIASSKSTSLVPPPETSPFGNPTPSDSFKEENFHALENPMGRADHFVYRIDIVDSFCDKFPIENNSLSGNPTPSDSVVESPSPSPIPYEDSDSLVEETDILLSYFDVLSDSHHEEFADELAHIISPSEYDRFYFDLEIVPGEFTRVLKENIFDLLTKGLKINELNNSPLLLYDCDSSLSKEFFEIDLLVSFPLGNEDIVFDPGIIIKGVQF